MKILIDARLYGLENTGLGRYAINLIKYLGQIDHRNEYFILLRRKYFDGLNLPKNWTKILTDFRHYSLSEQFKLPGIIDKINPDLTHFLHFNIPLFWKGKFVVTIHDMLMHKHTGLSATTLWPLLYGIKRVAYKKSFRQAVTKSSKILVPSNVVKREIAGYYKIDPAKITVTYEAADDRILSETSFAKIQEKYKIDSDYFIYTGSAYPHKNLQSLVKAVILLNKNVNRKMILLISSSRDMFTQILQRLIHKLEAEECVKFLGFVPDDDLRSLFKNSKSFVFPSLSEGFGLPGLEAMEAGTIVLASDIPVFREIYGKAAIYFNPYDFSSIEKAMRNAMSMDPKERSQMIESGKKFAKRYSWATMARQTLKIYAEEGGVGLRQG